MGFGNRRDIINRKETENMPSPLNYNQASIFEDNFKYKKGYSLSQKLNYKVNKYQEVTIFIFVFILLIYLFFYRKMNLKIHLDHRIMMKKMTKNGLRIMVVLLNLGKIIFMKKD